jgi:hypothetical protein
VIQAALPTTSPIMPQVRITRVVPRARRSTETFALTPVGGDVATLMKASSTNQFHKSDSALHGLSAKSKFLAFLALCVLASCGEEKTVEGKSREVEKEVVGDESKQAKEEPQGLKEFEGKSRLISSNDPRMLEWKEIRALAEAGDAAAQVTLGTRYQAEVGKSVMANKAEAVIDFNKAQTIKWFRKSAEQGNPSAQRNLAYFYEWGDYQVPMDKAEAMKLYSKAAEQGDVFAKNWLKDNTK